MKLYFIAGEHSGDFIGGKVITAMAKNHNVIGIGGPKMIAAGMRQSLFDFQQINLMGFFEILPHIFSLKKLINQTVDDIIKTDPQVLVTIDSPGFTFRVAKLVKARAPHIKLVHIVAPSVWAYKPGRAKKYAMVYDKLLTLLPFEPPYFTKHGLNAVCIGHPVLEGIRHCKRGECHTTSLRGHEVAEAISGDSTSRFMRLPRRFAPRNDVVGLLTTRNDDTGHSIARNDDTGHSIARNNSKTIAITPGSRKGEIARHIKIIKEALEILTQKHKVKAIFVQPNEQHIPYIEGFLKGAAFDYTFSTDRIQSFHQADVVLAKSGTNTLEISACGTPMIVGYKLNPLSYLLIKMLIKVKYASIVNIIARKEIIPEYIQWDFTAEKLATGLEELLLNEDKAHIQVEEAQRILRSLGFGAKEKPSEKAAREIVMTSLQ